MPKMTDRLANFFGYVKEVALSPLGLWDQAAIPPWKQTEMIEAYKSWVFACVRARSNDVAQIKLHLYKVLNRKTGEVEEVTDVEILSLMRSVNGWMTWRDLVKTMQIYKDLGGEAFWYLNRVGKGKNSKVTGIWPLRPDWIYIDASSDKFIRQYEYRMPGAAPQMIDPMDIIHFKNFNPIDPYRGMSIVGAAATTIDTDDQAEKYNRNFFRNSAVPSVVLSTEQKLNKTITDRVRAGWNKEYQGPDKAHRMAILEGGLTVTPFTMSQKDMEFLLGQNFNMNKIFALFQTPKSVLGMTEGVTVSNNESSDQVFSKRAIAPEMQAFVDTLNEFLLPRIGLSTDDYFWDFDSPIPENVDQNLKIEQAMWGMGALTPNEIRVNHGYDEEVGLDNFYIPFNMTPIMGDVALGAADVPTPVKRHKKLKKFFSNIPALTLKGKIVSDVRSEVVKAMGKQFAANEQAKKKARAFVYKKQQLMPLPQQAAFSKSQINKGLSYEALYKQKLQSIFHRQAQETKQRLDDLGTKAIKLNLESLRAGQIDDVLISVNAETKISADITIPVLQDLAEKIGTDALELVGITGMPFDMTSETMKAFFKEDAVRDLKAMNVTTRQQLRKALSQVVQAGKGLPEAKQAVQEVFDSANSVRAQMIARTEISKATSTATLEGYQQSGVVVGKQWYTAEDERVCEWCSQMTTPDGNGVVTGLDENFFDKGTTFTGRDGGVLDLGYENIDTPPLHPNCRCTIVPVLKSL